MALSTDQLFALWLLRNNPAEPTPDQQMVAAHRSAFDSVFRVVAYRDMDGPCFCSSMATPHEGWVHSPLCVEIRRSLDIGV